MDKNFFFFKTFLKNPRETGSIIPSSKFLVNNMLKGLDFKNAKCIVEYGPGTGCITKEILKKAGKDARVVCFEINKRFSDYLNKNIKDRRLVVINDSAENIGKHLKILGIDKADYVISALPFSNLPKNKKRAIIKEAEKALRNGGKFVTYQYINSLKKLLYDYFSDISTKFISLNIPPCFIYVCGK